jgi:drug/metabolite transporter (DMT)-like permease
MSIFCIISLTLMAMLAFAGNSLLCRIALHQTDIDAASFTTIRLGSGAITLLCILMLKKSDVKASGNWSSALALFAYAAGFSYAYTQLAAATGALLLFGAVQITMMGYGLWKGERLKRLQPLGFVLAFAGMVALLLPGISAPPLFAALLMLIAGIAWGVYSLRGKNVIDPLQVNAGNFLRAALMAIVLSLLSLKSMRLDMAGVFYAIVSGAIASAIGYAIWYLVLPFLAASHAAIVQLCVPVLAALGGMLFLNEALSLRFILASVAVLGGIALVVFDKKRAARNPQAK